MKSTLVKFKKFEIEKSKLKDIKGESWVCWMTDMGWCICNQTLSG